MPSPVIDSDDPERLLSRPDDGADPAPARPRLRRWPWALAGLLVAVPVLLTLAGALTSPPHARSVPVGHLIYLDADEPSDHTSILRGLRVMGPDGSSRQLLHETEPQDSDSGSREWITQPKASPDGHWLAFEKQVITLQEEKQAVDNQLWVMPLTGGSPRMLMDLTKQRLKQFVGLAWTPQSRSVVFLEDAQAYSVAATGDTPGVIHGPLKGVPSLKTTPDISATRSPDTDAHDISYEAITPQGTQAVIGGRPVPNVTVFAGGPIGPNGQTFAQVTADEPAVIAVYDSQTTRRLPARWGWSPFGKRRITALRWSPDGTSLAYSVSKPPLEDELFYVEPTTGKCFQLPVRTGRAGWDWAR